MEGFDILQAAEPVLVAPFEEPGAGPVVSHAGVLVADRRGEEFEEAACRAIAGIGDDRGHDDRRRDTRGDPRSPGGRDHGQILVRFDSVSDMALM